MEIKIVLVRHQNAPGIFAFKVPEDKFIEIGSYVLCDTKKGKDQIGRCVTPSFEVEEDMLGDFYGASAAKMKPITSLLIPFKYTDGKKGGQDGEESENG